MALRGRGVMWSPDDAARASQWFSLGLSAPTAVAVLQARVEAYRFARGASAPVPRDLRWYEPALLDACRHRMRFGATWLQEPAGPSGSDPAANVAAAEAGEAAGPLLGLLVAAQGLRTAANQPIWQHVLGVCIERLDAALAGGEQANPPEPEAVVLAMQTHIRKLLNAGLSDAQREAQQAFVTERLGPQANQLSKKARTERAKWLELQWAAAILGLRWPTLHGWMDPRANV